VVSSSSVVNDYTTFVIFAWFAMMLEENGYPEMHVIEMEDDLMIKTCELHGYQYTLITSDDIVIPPDSDYDFI
jgi:hypothetical protein